jgi:hypothetical protein
LIHVPKLRRFKIRVIWVETMHVDLPALFIGLLLSINSLAQEVRYVDLSGVDQPTDRAPYGSRVENFTCGGSEQLFPHRTKVSLEWIQTTDIYPQERLGMEVRVDNVGTSPINVPIHPTLTNLKPRDSAARFEYYSVRLPLETRVPGSGLLVGWLELYGSLSRPETFLTLKPGEWIRVRGDIIVQRSYERDEVVTALTDFWLSKYVFPAEWENTVAPSLQECVLPVVGKSMTAHMHP